MIIKWLGQSCIEIDTGMNKVIFDPFSPMGGFPELHLKGARVYASHEHGDHNNIGCVELVPWDVDDKICSVEDFQSFHDDKGGAERGENIIRIFRYDNDRIRVVHLGDLGHVLTGEVLEAVKNCDVLIVPIGGFFTIDGTTAAQVVKDVAPRTVIPVHYRTPDIGMPIFEDINPFVTALDGAYPIVEVPTNMLVYTKDTAEGVYVLKYEK